MYRTRRNRFRVHSEEARGTCGCDRNPLDLDLCMEISIGGSNGGQKCTPPGGLNSFIFMQISEADLKGGEGHSPPQGAKFFQFHAVFRKFWQNYMLASLHHPQRKNPILIRESTRHSVYKQFTYLFNTQKHMHIIKN